MNKYQEALDRIGRNYYLSQESGYFEHFEILYLENKKTLQELVDKATPKKHYTKANMINKICPSCHLIFGLDMNGRYEEHKHCPSCGQALDWSRDDNPHR